MAGNTEEQLRHELEQARSRERDLELEVEELDAQVAEVSAQLESATQQLRGQAPDPEMVRAVHAPLSQHTGHPPDRTAQRIMRGKFVPMLVTRESAWVRRWHSSKRQRMSSQRR